MENIYRQYKFKFYLNMNHYIIINDKPGEVHPHTWEIILSVIAAQSDMTPFVSIERKMDEIIGQYQDKLLNDCVPFDKVVPTVENAAKYFFRLIQDSIIQEGWILIMLEVSETPTRSYIINALFDEDDIWDEWYENIAEKNPGEGIPGQKDISLDERCRKAEIMVSTTKKKYMDALRTLDHLQLMKQKSANEGRVENEELLNAISKSGKSYEEVLAFLQGTGTRAEEKVGIDDCEYQDDDDFYWDEDGDMDDMGWNGHESAADAERYGYEMNGIRSVRGYDNDNTRNRYKHESGSVPDRRAFEDRKALGGYVGEDSRVRKNRGYEDDAARNGYVREDNRIRNEYVGEDRKAPGRYEYENSRVHKNRGDEDNVARSGYVHEDNRVRNGYVSEERKTRNGYASEERRARNGYVSEERKARNRYVSEERKARNGYVSEERKAQNRQTQGNRKALGGYGYENSSVRDRYDYEDNNVRSRRMYEGGNVQNGYGDESDADDWI